MGYLIDQAIALRIIYLLVKPIPEWDAFKYGIIDKDGNFLKKASQLRTTSEKDSWTMLHRLVLRIKKLLAVLPAGRSMLVSFAAAYLLVKENSQLDPDDAMTLFAEQLNHIDDHGMDDELLEEFKAMMKELDEEGIANVTAGIEPTTPRIKPKKLKVKKISGPTSRKFITPSINESVIYFDSTTQQFFMVD